MDLSKVSPMPWRIDIPRKCIRIKSGENFVIEGGACFGFRKLADAEFVVMATRAFDGDPEALAWWEANRRDRSKPGE